MWAVRLALQRPYSFALAASSANAGAADKDANAPIRKGPMRRACVLRTPLVVSVKARTRRLSGTAAATGVKAFHPNKASLRAQWRTFILQERVSRA
jgi:hypothetical protein